MRFFISDPQTPHRMKIQAAENDLLVKCSPFRRHHGFRVTVGSA
jgi:hypothetical protein